MAGRKRLGGGLSPRGANGELWMPCDLRKAGVVGGVLRPGARRGVDDRIGARGQREIEIDRPIHVWSVALSRRAGGLPGSVGDAVRAVERNRPRGGAAPVVPMIGP